MLDSHVLLCFLLQFLASSPGDTISVECSTYFQAPLHSQGMVMQQPPQAVIPPQPVARSGGPVPPDMLAKLRSELDVVQGNVRVMSEMLTELSPSDVDSSDLELLQVSKLHICAAS